MRLVITGTPGAGKTAFVKTASDIEIIDTDRKATDVTSSFKSRTTVAFDFGRVAIDPDLELHVYGTPGQYRFDFMWDILIQRAHAYMLLVAAHRPNDLPQALQILSFMSQRVQIPFVIGITHLDCPGAYSPEEILIRLGFRDAKHCPPVVSIDATNRISVKTGLDVLLLTLLLARKKAGMGAVQPPLPPQSHSRFPAVEVPRQSPPAYEKPQHQVSWMGGPGPASTAMPEKPH